MIAVLSRLAILGFACAIAAPASAQLLNQKSLSAAIAMTIAQTALETCTKQGYHVSVHVLGRNGEVIVAVRGDDAPPHTMENSQRKAYTSRTFRIPSGEFVCVKRGSVSKIGGRDQKYILQEYRLARRKRMS